MSGGRISFTVTIDNADADKAREAAEGVHMLLRSLAATPADLKGSVMVVGQPINLSTAKALKV